jgi:hypothetical protein
MGDEAHAFSVEQEDILRALLDEVIPPSTDGRLPGAGGLGLIGHVARTVRQTPMLVPVVEYGLSAIVERAGARSPDGWAGLSRAERSALLAEFARDDQLFMPALLFLAYSGYYQHPRVVETLGLEARPPHPKGYTMEAFDPSLLDAVRRRGKIYRDV